MFIPVAYAAEVAAHPSVTEQIAGTFGLDVRLFAAQLLNFAIILFIFARFVYKPLVSFMKTRADRIASGLEKERQATIRLKDIEEERKGVLAKAEEEGRSIILQSQTAASAIEAKAKAEADAFAVETRQRVARESEHMRTEALRDVRAQAADLVVLAAEKVLREKIDAKKDRELIERALKEVEN